MLDQLLATPGVQERCELGSSFGFLALHGGLEAGTAEIAQAAAVASNASIYTVVQPDDMRWHIPSHHVRPVAVRRVGGVPRARRRGRVGARVRRACAATTTAGSPGCSAVPTVCSPARLAALLRDALPGYRWIDDLERIPSHLRGVHPDNPVNRHARRRRAARAPAPRAQDARATAPRWWARWPRSRSAGPRALIASARPRRGSGSRS